MYLMLEYCNGGDLSSFLKTHTLSEEEALKLMLQFNSGLKVLWENNVIHRDLKPQNLLLSISNENLITLKIGDFGYAKTMEDSLMETLCGTPLYMAPEILKGGQIKYTNKADLWSVGCILYEMLFGKPPYGAKNQKELFDNIQGKKLDFPQIPPISKEALDLVKKLLMKEYADRISWVDYFDHFWFSKKEKTHWLATSIANNKAI